MRSGRGGRIHFYHAVGARRVRPGYEPVIGFATDFESGAVGWATSGTQNTWTLTADGGVDGSAGWYGQDVGSPSDQRLVSPPVTIPTGLTPTLQFMNAQAFEAPDQDGRCWDGAILEVSTDDGGTWDYLSNTVMYADADPYDNIFRTTANPIADDGAGGFREGWCDAAQPYTNAVVDVSAYVSETVRFRWRLGTDSSIGAEGWYVDEVQVQACRINMAAIEMSASPMQTAARGTTVTHTIHITNTAAVSDSYGLTTAGSAWATVLGAPTVSLAAGEAVTVPVMVSVPMTAAIGQTDAAMVTAVSGNDGSVSAQAAVATTAIDPVGLQVVVAPPTQTVTATHTVTLTGLITNVTGLTQTVDVTVGGPYTATVTPISATVSAGETVSVSVGVLVPPMPLDAAAVAVTAAPRDARFSSVTGTAVLVYAPPPPAVYRLYLPFVVGR